VGVLDATPPLWLGFRKTKSELQCGLCCQDQSGLQKTIDGRAKRLCKRLIAAMPEISWRVSNKSGVTSACNAATLRSRSGMPPSGRSDQVTWFATLASASSSADIL
jgi:hypothetical protein